MASRSTPSRAEVGEGGGPGGILPFLEHLNLGLLSRPSQSGRPAESAGVRPWAFSPTMDQAQMGRTPSSDHILEQDAFHAYSHFVLITCELLFVLPVQFAERKTVSRPADPESEVMGQAPDSPSHPQAAAQGRGARLAQAVAPRGALLDGSRHFLKLLPHPPDSGLLWGSTLVSCFQEVPSDF